MPRFKCINKNCNKFDQVELVPCVKFVFNEKTGKLVADKAVCKECGKMREQLVEEGDINNVWFKPENAKNYNNKKVKRYDFDPAAAKSETVKLSKGNL